ncbi:sugar ABC transporter permease [Jatrophihabitans telluris]|uniref:Sugar ABC transporter permease n=1 Tax=Jatrophihabitans telluris TaxID=2038343 RepID=A0ABY4R401_9ACTN|nr:sugar ABC transporter permease [Jatrophihabitans telluris]UQX89856.1 sugar ABC transporter permease [Jatrophihabitans telluris]
MNDWAHSSSAAGKIAFALVVAAAFLAVIGLLLLLVDRAPKKGQEKIQAFIFLLPAAVLIIIGLLGPIITTAVQSFTSGERKRPNCFPRPGHSCLLDKGGSWIGFDNYKWAFSDQQTQQALWNTLKWVLIAPAAATIIGLAYAVVIDGIRGESLAKALVFLPNAISFVGAAVIWGLMYAQPSGLGAEGLVNKVLGWFNLGPLGFLQNNHTTYFLIVIMIWIQAGFGTVLLSAAIKGVPQELIEASKIDGASPWQTFRKVVVPSIRPTIIVVFVTISVATLKIFDLVQAFGANQHGGDTLANRMFTIWKQGGISIGAGGTVGDHRSSTIAMIIFLLVIPFVAFQVRQMVRARAGR